MNGDRFEGRVAVVTGAGSGIGEATALAFAQAGALVMAVDRNLEAVQSTMDQIRRAGGRAHCIQTDVGQASAVAEMVAKTVEAYGRLDVLFNNAGVSGIQGKRLADVEEDAFDEIMRVNVKGVWLGMKYAIPAMLANGGGCIVNNASTLGLVTQTFKGAYSASKHAVIGLTKSAAVEYGRAGIRVNAVCPGGIETESTRRFRSTFSPEVWDERNAAAYPATGRWAQPSEIASVVLFLCSDAASNIHGTAIAADGGYLAQ